ncbi:hypothetical protein KO525_01235 [Psychrosphaera sp. B3R10]|uniref:Uncharacterized protein n=1 Tax=Psychrosphaera algicola TaxID=3023714 RepID=A0ABT5FEW0_9GAMM|nr:MULTISPECIES: hypothetical protein [unclassified Psychrosphaera]MBU2883687.1 hypothetical protein [Psychrosphaera sp. I2R16]MBU2988011.1 hypothetical protein [Psychrosphaera sp. B3R10]MDC2890069.1 hypothetical protein [Psychrosphaera sp. G1-22]MDO6720339.1 hypothetical protein [Psychrosphaera sp. 1_MG-2023]
MKNVTGKTADTADSDKESRGIITLVAITVAIMIFGLGVSVGQFIA